MLGKISIVAAAAVIATAVIAALAFAHGGHGNRLDHHGKGHGGKTITVIEHATTDTPVHVGGGSTDSTGDQLTFHNEVFNKTNTKKVGTDLGNCVLIEPNVSYECAWTTFLPGGQIDVQGPFLTASNTVMSITGGTGKFRNASGQMQLISQAGGTEFKFVFQLN